MDLMAVSLSLTGVLFIAGHNVVKRQSLLDGQLTPSEFLALSQGIASIFLVTMVWWEWSSTPFHLNQRVFWMAVSATAAVNLVVQYANARAAQLAEASLIAPIQALTPGLVTITALVLGERPTPQGIAGIGLIALGTYIHGRENATTLREYLQPFAFLRLPANFQELSLEAQQQALKNRTALRFAYSSAVAGSVALVFDGLLARNGNVALGMAVKQLMLTLFFGSAALLGLVRNNGHCQKGRIFQKWPLLLGAGVFLGLNEVLIGTAFRVAPVAYIGSLKRLSIIFVILLSWWFLREVKAKRRLFPALLVTGGAGLLATDGSMASIVRYFNTVLE